MIIEQVMEPVLAMHARASLGQPCVVLITGDAGIGKSYFMAECVKSLPTPLTNLSGFYTDDTPLTLTERVLSHWAEQLDGLRQSHNTRLNAMATKLGLDNTLIDTWLGTLDNREQRLQHIKQQLPWLKKMTPGLKADLDQLLDLMANPWLGIAQKRKARLPVFLASKKPAELAHLLVDEWVWLHEQLPTNAGVWSLWLDGLDNLQAVTPDWEVWLGTLIKALGTAEQLKAFLVISCRAEQLSRWFAPTFNLVKPILLGQVSAKQQKVLLLPYLDGISVDADAWLRFMRITQGNQAAIAMLGLGLAQRRSLFLDGITLNRLDTIGLVSERALHDWWLVPIQLTPGADTLGAPGIRHLLAVVARQVDAFTAPRVLTAAGIDENMPDSLQAAFNLLQQLLLMDLIVPTDEPLHYRVVCRYGLEQLANRFSLATTEEAPNDTLSHVLEVTLLTGHLDQHQLGDLWQWCQQADDADTLRPLWVSVAERALRSSQTRVVVGGVVALALANQLRFKHIQPLLDYPGLADMAWRLACDLPWTDDQDQPIENSDTLLKQGLAHKQASIRACALQCAQTLQVLEQEDWLLSALEDTSPWVRQQALLLISQHHPHKISAKQLLKLANQPELLSTVIPLLRDNVPAETTVPVALEQWHKTTGSTQSRWLGFLRQVPLSQPVEQALLNALKDAETPDLIWTLHQKLWKDVPRLRDSLTELALQPATPWPDWLKTAIQQRCNALIPDDNPLPLPLAVLSS